jgi:pyruvate ferredoxin oxidoreductase alpha subunit
MAYRLAEHKNIRLPIIVNLDGFYLSFTREPVDIPDQAAVRQFVGIFDPGNIRFRASMPESQAVAVLGGSPYSYFRYETHLAMLEALNAYPEIAEEFNEQFGRYHGILECFQCEDADYVFFMMGCFATKAKDAVIKLREAGIKIGLLRPRLIRPFPGQAIATVVSGKQGVAVIDQNLSMGKGGILHAELASVLYGMKEAPSILASFIGGLGGRDISQQEFFQMAEILIDAVKTGQTPPPKLLYTEREFKELKNLRAIAQVERQQLKEPQS